MVTGRFPIKNRDFSLGVGFSPAAGPEADREGEQNPGELCQRK
jgi:hypothetical protein